MADPDKIVADIDRKQNEEDLANLNKYVKEPAKAAFKKMKEGLLGTDEQNKDAKERMRKMDEKNPNSAQAKVNKALGMKAGGKVSSASKRADGCAVKGKTRGRMV
jgi:predicted Zn-dependent protease